MKYFLTVYLIILSSVCFCQKQDIYFFKDNGLEVSIKDSADYIRVIQEPDLGKAKFKVVEYYKNGKPKRRGESSAINPLKYEGLVVSYFENGTRSSISRFSNGRQTGACYLYYPNGKLQETRQYPDSLAQNQLKNYLLLTSYDADGNALVTNGNGYYRGIDILGSGRFAEGKIVDGKRDSVWKGNYPNGGPAFTEQYNAGELLSGICITDNKRKFTYTAAPSLPDISNISDISRIIVTELRSVFINLQSGVSSITKSSATERAPGMSAEARFNEVKKISDPFVLQGVVLVSFIVDKNGKTREFKIEKSLNQFVDPHVLRVVISVLKNNTHIKPAFLNGEPINAPYTIPINFKGL